MPKPVHSSPNPKQTNALAENQKPPTQSQKPSSKDDTSAAVHGSAKPD